ncbi:MAG: CDP-alcohol phosphatidyltransferase family protein [bacterium]|nr:CDP-alcohol phosphatidyltransferase family protein [bacterium]
MLGFYNYTVVLTYAGMLISFVGAAMVLNGNTHAALLCLMISGLCDMFDGKVASTKKDRTAKEKRFGIQIDSLSDLISFGVLPALLIYCIADKSTYSLFGASLYVLCALIRLAYFNVDEEERQNQTTERRTVYLGLPVTTVALIIPMVITLASVFVWPMQIVGPVMLLAIAIAFITPFQIKKPGNVGKVIMLIVGVAQFLVLVVR